MRIETVLGVEPLKGFQEGETGRDFRAAWSVADYGKRMRRWPQNGALGVVYLIEVSWTLVLGLR